MHRTLKVEATRPAGSNFLQQQAKFDAFVEEFNNEGNHGGENLLLVLHNEHSARQAASRFPRSTGFGPTTVGWS